jgi:adenosine deaminase CECR1
MCKFLALLLGGFLLITSPAHASAALRLQDKLQLQWTKFQKAQDLAIARVRQTAEPSQIQITRDEWEKTLALVGPKALTEEDVEHLRRLQKQRILLARENFKKASIFDLEFFRKLPADNSKQAIKGFCADFPKGGLLHVHPFGTFNHETLNELLKQNDPKIPVEDILKHIQSSNGHSSLTTDETQKLSHFGSVRPFHELSIDQQNALRDFMFLPPGKQLFPRFNAVFEFLGAVVQSDADYEKALSDFAIRAVREGVSYVELTGGTSEKAIAAAKKIQEQTGLMIRLNRSFNRTRTPDDLAAQTQAALKTPRDPLWVGIDLLDNEEGHPALESGLVIYANVLSAVRAGRSNLHRTMHAGEIGDPRDPRDAMILGAERIGHGVNLAQDPIALEYAARQHIAVEINLSSNLRLTSIKTLKDHPFLDYLRLGLPVSLSTDDEGIFDTDIQNECELAVAQTDITYAELKKMSYNSISASFASTSDKRLLRKRLHESLLRFERSLKKQIAIEKSKSWPL